MLIKGICTNCAGHLEFEEENTGEKIDCPHCGFETVLLVPGSEELAELAAVHARKATLRQRLIWSGAGALLLGIAFATYHWGLPIVKDILPYTENQAWPVIVLVLICVAAPFALAWLVLPVFVFLQLGQLTRTLEEIETHLRSRPPEAPEESSADEMNPAAEEPAGEEKVGT